MKEVPQSLGLDRKSSSKSTDLQTASLSLKMTTVQVVKTQPTKSLPMALLTHSQISSFQIYVEEYFLFTQLFQKCEIDVHHVSRPTGDRYSRYGPVRFRVYGEETGFRTNAANDLSQSESKESRFASSLIGLESFAQVDLVSLEACVSM